MSYQARFTPVRPFLGFALSWVWLAAIPAFSQNRMDMTDVLSIERSNALARCEKGLFKEALEAQNRALKEAENRYGRVHLSIVPVLNDAGTIHRYLAQYREAEQAYKWGLAVREKSLEQEDPLIAESLVALASLYEDMGRFEDAEPLARRAAQLTKKSDSALYLKSLYRLGIIQGKLKNYADAEKTLAQCVETGQKAFESKNPFVAKCLETLAKANQANGHATQAENNLQQALSLRKRNFAVNSEEAADTLKALGDFHAAQGDKEKALSYYGEAVKIYKQFTGIDASYSAVPLLNKAAAIYQAAGDAVAAKTTREKILKTLEKTLGPNHPRTALCLSDIAQSEAALGETTAALKHLKEAQGILKNTLGPDHPLTARVSSIKLQ